MMDGYVSEGRQEANDIDRTRVPLVGSALGLVEAPDSNGGLNQAHYQYTTWEGAVIKKKY